jgi:hypothetical protein
MFKACVSVVALVVFSAMLLAPHFALAEEKPMALTKQNLVSAALKMKKALEQEEVPDPQKTKNPNIAKMIISRTVVLPITETAPGCDYDATVYQIARLVGSATEPADPEYQIALRFIFKSLFVASTHLRFYGYITEPTQKAMEETLLLFQ